MHLLIIRVTLCLGSMSFGLSRPSSAAPDIAILLTDQQQASAMSVAGTPGIQTPAMDGLAREGVRFTHAFCATPQCSPARAAMWTGRYPHRTGVMGNVAGRAEPPAGMSGPLDPSIPSIGKVFAAAGYETAYFGKWHLGRDPGEHGFEVHDHRLRDEHLASGVTTFLDQRDRREEPLRPLLLIASWVNPHDIYHVGRAAAQRVTVSDAIRLPENLQDTLQAKPLVQRHFLTMDQGAPFVDYTPEQWRRYRAFYFHLTEKVDAEIARVVAALRARNPRTLTVFLSDHGDLAGAHGMPFKGPAMYDELVRVPLIVSWPEKLKPAVCAAPVNQIDLLPTLCELAGVDPSSDMDGASLVPLLRGGKPLEKRMNRAIYGEYYGKQNWRAPIRMVRTPRWKYVRYRAYGEELYDLENDPHELRNLAEDAASEQTRLELAERLESWMAGTNDPFAELTPTDRSGRPLPADGGDE